MPQPQSEDDVYLDQPFRLLLIAPVATLVGLTVKLFGTLQGTGLSDYEGKAELCRRLFLFSLSGFIAMPIAQWFTRHRIPQFLQVFMILPSVIMTAHAGLSGIILLNDYASHITTVGSEAEKVATRAFIQNEINIVRSYTIALIALYVFSLSVYRDDLPPKAASRRKPMDPEVALLSSMLANSSSSEREHAPTTSSQHKYKSLASRGQGSDSNLTLYDPPSACVTSPSGALFDRVPSRG